MSILKLSAKEAFRNLSDNIYSRWFESGIDVGDIGGDYAVQRMKCKYFTPSVNAKNIGVSLEDTVFTIGSCFARGIERSLLARGFDVKSASSAFDSFELWNDSVTALGSTNKYNTYSILNEIRWALDDGALFPKRSIVEISNNRWVDPHVNPTLKFVDKKRTIERRSIVTRVNRRISECKVVMVTLGLTEVWRDDEENVYLNMTPKKDMRERYPDRYSFHVLDFQENLDNLEKVSGLLFKYGHPDVKIIVTVSPVPLVATFTYNDVVVANALSKSILRAVAETWASRYDNIVYFPSYEMVVNSERSLAWTDDGRHVDGKLVKHIMDLFVSEFVT